MKRIFLSLVFVPMLIIASEETESTLILSVPSDRPLDYQDLAKVLSIADIETVKAFQNLVKEDPRSIIGNFVPDFQNEVDIIAQGIARCNVGVVFFEVGKDRVAESIFKSVTKNKAVPDHLRGCAHHNLAVLYYEKNDMHQGDEHKSLAVEFGYDTP